MKKQINNALHVLKVMQSLLDPKNDYGRAAKELAEVSINDLTNLVNDKKYCIDPRGDVAFSEVKKIFYTLGYRPINEQCHISRTGFNCIGIIFGNWVSWSASEFEKLGFEVVSYEDFINEPTKYIPAKK